jgi:hypothetical protein
MTEIEQHINPSRLYTNLKMLVVERGGAARREANALQDLPDDSKGRVFVENRLADESLKLAQTHLRLAELTGPETTE